MVNIINVKTNQLIGIKTRDNLTWRRGFFKKVEKLGFIHKPSPFYKNGFIIITPDHTCESIPYYLFDAFMFEGYYMYEAENERDFLDFISKKND